MRRSVLILALFTLMLAASGQNAHAKLFFGTQDKINYLQDISVKGPQGEALFLGFLTSTHNFMLPYSMSDGGHVLGIKGVSDKFYKLPKERIEQLQRAGALPNPLPPYRHTVFDYLFAYILWWCIPATLALIGLFSMLGIGSRRRDEIRSA